MLILIDAQRAKLLMDLSNGIDPNAEPSAIRARLQTALQRSEHGDIAARDIVLSVTCDWASAVPQETASRLRTAAISLSLLRRESMDEKVA